MTRQVHNQFEVWILHFTAIGLARICLTITKLIIGSTSYSVRFCFDKLLPRGTCGIFSANYAGKIELLNNNYLS